MIILNTDMPDNCADCPLCYDDIYCNVTRSAMGQDWLQNKKPDCPIVAEMCIEKTDTGCPRLKFYKQGNMISFLLYR